MSLVRDNIEVTTNMILGAVINYLLTLLIFGVSMQFALGTTIIFAVASYVRSLLIRRCFRKNESKGKVKK